jgi:hypothetical protein
LNRPEKIIFVENQRFCTVVRFRSPNSHPPPPPNFAWVPHPLRWKTFACGGKRGWGDPKHTTVHYSHSGTLYTIISLRIKRMFYGQWQEISLLVFSSRCQFSVNEKYVFRFETWNFYCRLHFWSSFPSGPETNSLVMKCFSKFAHIFPLGTAGPSLSIVSTTPVTRVL